MMENKRGKKIICIDIGGTAIKSGIMDENMNFLRTDVMDTPRGGAGIMDAVLERISEYLSTAANPEAVCVSSAGIISEDDIPVTLRMLLGYTTRERLNTFVHDVIENSLEQDTIKMSAEIYEAMMDLRALMFQNVYENPAAHKEEEKVVKMLTELYEYYVEHPEAMSTEYRELIVRGEKKEQAVCDYLSGMTDQYSIRKFREIYIPKAWEVY